MSCAKQMSPWLSHHHGIWPQFTFQLSGYFPSCYSCYYQNTTTSVIMPFTRCKYYRLQFIQGDFIGLQHIFLMSIHQLWTILNPNHSESQILFLCCLLSLLVQHGKVFKDLLAKPKRSVLCPWCLYKMLKTSKFVDAPMSPDSGLCSSHLSSLHCTGKCSCPLSPLLVNTAAVPFFACDYGCVQQHPLSPLVFACVVWSDPIHKLNPE